MTLGWMLGWAVPEAWFAGFAHAAFPSARHVFAPAAPAGWDLLERAGPFDWVAGYSLGSLLFLSEPERAEALAPGGVALLAPIFAFPAEEGLGGRVPRARVRALAGWLRREPLAALADFYARAGLRLASAPGTVLEQAHPGGILPWGLEQLAGRRVDPPLPAGWLGWCGDEDPFLDAGRIAALAPGVRRLAGASHHPGALVQALADALEGRPADGGAP